LPVEDFSWDLIEAPNRSLRHELAVGANVHLVLYYGFRSQKSRGRGQTR
jgi:hypothetical protein